MDNKNDPETSSRFETVSHRDIITRAGGSAQVRDLLTPAVPYETVKAWLLQDSIPGPYWASFAAADLATLDELAAAASLKRRAAVPDSDVA